MAYEHSPGTFSLFKNDKKTDKHPDYTGYGKDADGKDIEVAAWIREGGKGKFMFCKVKPKQGQQPQTTRTPAKKDGGIDLDNDIPF